MSFFKKIMGEVNKLMADDDAKPLTNQQEEHNNISDDSEEESRVEYDPVTQHGTHYSEEDFEAEVERRAQAWIENSRNDGELLTQQDRDNIYNNFRDELYIQLNEPDEQQLLLWKNTNAVKYTGFAVTGFVNEDESNLLLEPIHGITLKDYGAICAKLADGIAEEEICKALKLEKPVLDEVNTLWVKRMQEDSTFTISALFGQYFGEASQHPLLGQLKATQTAQGSENLERFKTDRYYYEELNGARQAAYDYGIDGAQWIADNYGITLGDFQSVAMQWATADNKTSDFKAIQHFYNYREEKQKEYAEKFAGEMGGNVADDVEF